MKLQKMCACKDEGHLNKEIKTIRQVDSWTAKVYLRRMSVLSEIAPKLQMWKFSGFLFVLVLALNPSSALCVPGNGWQMLESNGQDVGANSYTTAYLNVSYMDPETKKLRTEKSEIGKYGDGKVGSAFGVLVHVSSWEGGYTGCAAPLRSSQGDGSLPQEPWIALVKRGQCNFEVKVENAFRHNASAILVYNDRESPTLDKMKLTGIRNMSAVFTYKWKGEQLAKLVDNGTRVMVHITVATHCTRPNVQVNRTSVLFVSISFVVLMLTSLAWLVFYYVQRFRYLHAKDRLSKRLCNAAKKALSKIPTKEIQQEDREVQGDGECCAICMEPYKVTDDLRILPCRHEFHKGCIDPWLLEHRTCPMCKMNILKHYGFVSSNSQESVLDVDLERGNEDNSGLGVSSNIETELRAETETQTDKSNFQSIYSTSRTENEEEQSDQLLNGEGRQECCAKCRSKADKMKKSNGAKSTGTGCCISKGFTRNTSQLLTENPSDTSQKSKGLIIENPNYLNGNTPSHSKSYKFIEPDTCDSEKDVDDSISCGSETCDNFDDYNKDKETGEISAGDESSERRESRCRMKLPRLQPVKFWKMVRTRSDLKGVRVATKAPRKMPASSSSTPGRSSKKYEGGNSYCPRETPPWQKEITKFFSAQPNVNSSGNSSESQPCSSTSTQDTQS